MILTESINRIVRLEKDILDKFTSISIQINLPEGAVLLAEGKTSDEIYYVSAGLVRAYYFEDGKDVTSWLAYEGDFVCSLPSYLLRKPSRETIQLLEPATLQVVNRIDLEALRAQHDQIDDLQCALMQVYLLRYDNRIRLLRIPKAADRLKAFMAHSPRLYNRVPQRFIASFLGIEPATLSRLRSGYRRR